MSNNQNRSTTPGMASWVIATASGLTILFVCILVIVISTFLYRARNYQALKHSFRTGQASDIQAYLNRIFDQPKILRWVTLDDSHTREVTQTHTMKLNHVVKMLKQGHYEKSRRRYLIARNSGLEPFLERRSQGSQALAVLPELDEKYERLSKFLKSRKDNNEKLEKANANKITMESQFYLVAEDFGNLLSLDPEMRNLTNVPRVYKKGILKDLPILANLPDNIQDFKMFGKIIKALRATVNVKGKDLHKELTENLEHLRESTSGIMTGYNELTKNITDYEDKNRKLDLRIRRYKRAIERELALLILTLTEPRLCHSLRIPSDFLCPNSNDFWRVKHNALEL